MTSHYAVSVHPFRPQVYRFFNHKAASLHRQRKNARKLDWTVLARRMNKKGVTATVQRKKNRRVIKATRGFNGASVDDINKIATQKSAVREAARRSAIQKAKDTKKQSEATKKAAAAKVCLSLSLSLFSFLMTWPPDPSLMLYIRPAPPRLPRTRTRPRRRWAQSP